ncbi:hypothetical protein ACGH52_02335 [Streptomyces sp. BBFR25]|uniref:hypothetical protein n=1 Tax=Streptomyces sp. BBFR25 TaxID=3372855 RepID=UPI0037DC7ECA
MVVGAGGVAVVEPWAPRRGPGLDVVTLDPKSSGPVIGPEGFADAAAMSPTAR